MKRLAEYTVFSGLVTAWRLAIVPTRTSPLSSQATTEGVRRAPSSLTMTLASLPSITATTLLVVPRSMPMILPMMLVLLNAALDSARALFRARSPPPIRDRGGPRKTVAHGGRERPNGREREQHNHRPAEVNSVNRGNRRAGQDPEKMRPTPAPAPKERAPAADFGLTGTMAQLLSASLLGR